MNLKGDFTKLKTTNKKHEKMFSFIMKTFTDTLNFTLKIENQIEGVGGFFTKPINFINKISINADSLELDLKNKIMNFKTDKDFIIFIHEFSHFYHFTVNKGNFTHLNSKLEFKNFQKNIFACEYEAGFLSLEFNKNYNFSSIKNIEVINFINLLNYMHIPYNLKAKIYECSNKLENLNKLNKIFRNENYNLWNKKYYKLNNETVNIINNL